MRYENAWSVACAGASALSGETAFGGRMHGRVVRVLRRIQTEPIAAAWANGELTRTGGGGDGLAQSAHRTVDDVSGRLSGAAHRAVDSAADVATTASEWASSLPDQAKSAQARFNEAACESIRARPMASLAGALVVGYLIGRLARY